MRHIAVVGGGPGGLLTAALIKERRPELEIDLYERNRADESFGFGVVFSGAKLDRLGKADARLGEDLLANGRRWDEIQVHLKGESLVCGGLGFAAVARRRLLAALQGRAAAAGVRLHFSTDVDPVALTRKYDLVIGADGVGSRTREAFAESFGPTIDTAAAKYIWFGADRALDSMTFLFEATEAGWFAVHAYPYDDSSSTFLVECDEQTWRRAGLDSADDLPLGASDEASRIAMQELFSKLLDGATLVGNNSRWLNFRTLRTTNWVHENVVLVGDAAHTAHFSVGSGTTMALEDGIALAEAIASTVNDVDLPQALRVYEAFRRPGVCHIQDAALPSMSWWEHFGQYAQLPPRQFMVHFLTRSGRVSFDRLERGDAGFAAETLRWFELGSGNDVLARPLTAASEDLPSRVLSVDQAMTMLPDARWVTAPAHLREVEEELASIEDGTPLIVRAGGTDLESRTAALLLSELARIERGMTVAIVLDSRERGEFATHLLSGRTDLVLVSDGSPDAVAPAGTGR
jgi:2-polyprenyl-6-methoxyphenol hydroxylase-like FAD-dependent oxidoreductase